MFNVTLKLQRERGTRHIFDDFEIICFVLIVKSVFVYAHHAFKKARKSNGRRRSFCANFSAMAQ